MILRQDIPDRVTWAVIAIFAAPLMIIAVFAVVAFVWVAAVTWCLI